MFQRTPSVCPPDAVSLIRDAASDLPEFGHHFPVAPSRARPAMGAAALAVALLVGGGFLWSQIPSTPLLRVQLAILGSLALCGAAYYLRQSTRDLLARFELDERGVHLRPAWLGFSIPWRQLERWEVNEIRSDALSVPGLLFWRKQGGAPRRVPAALLSPEARRRIGELLSLIAPQQQRQPMQHGP